MIRELSSFRRDWQRWSPVERLTVKAFLVVTTTGLLGQLAHLVS